MTDDSFREHELKQEQEFSLLGRITARASDLEAELGRNRREISRVASAWLNRSRFASANNGNINSSKTVVAMDLDDDSSSDNASIAGTPRDTIPFVGVGAMSELTMVPKRNLGWASWNTVSNAGVSLRLAWRCLYSFPVRGAVVSRSPVGFVTGVGYGVATSIAFLGLGFVVSPLIHLTGGAVNNVHGLRNVFTNDRTFDVYRGVYRPIDLRHEHDDFLTTWRTEQQLLARGRRDHRRQKARSDHIARTFPLFQFMKERIGQVGGIGPTAGGHGAQFDKDKRQQQNQQQYSDSEDNYYRLLQVSPSATDRQIKESYRKFAKVLHPDVDPSPKAKQQFERISKAYQTLINPQLRKAYDTGGAKFADMTRETKNNAAGGNNGGGEGGASVILQGTPMDVMQRVFGGTPLEQLLVGPLYRSMWHMRAQGSTRVNLHVYEALETMRMLRLATFLAGVLDTYAMSDEALCLFVKEELEKMPSAAHLAEKISLVVLCTTSSSNARNTVNNSSKDPFKIHATKKATTATATTTADSNSKKKTQRFSLSSILSHLKTVDVPAQADSDASPSLDAFTKRSTVFAQRLSRCCFGRELLNEIGKCYVVNAQRYLGEVPMWKARWMVTKAAATGMGRMKRALTGTADPKDPTKILSAADAAHFFALEFDNVVCNLWMVVRYVAMSAARDCSIEESVREALFPSSSSAAAATRSDPDGSHVVTPLLLTQRLSSTKKHHQHTQHTAATATASASVIQKRPAASPQMKSTIATLSQLPEAERKQLTAAVAKRVQHARCVALKELGRVFVAVGTPWKDKPLQECIEEIRKVGASQANNTLPPAF